MQYGIFGLHCRTKRHPQSYLPGMIALPACFAIAGHTCCQHGKKRVNANKSTSSLFRASRTTALKVPGKAGSALCCRGHWRMLGRDCRYHPHVYMSGLRVPVVLASFGTGLFPVVSSLYDGADFFFHQRLEQLAPVHWPHQAA